MEPNPPGNAPFDSKLELPAHLDELASVTRGFMPKEEGETLAFFALKTLLERPNHKSFGKIVEVGSYCGLSTIYLGFVASKSNSIVISVDHHYGSIENSSGWQYHDSQLVDPETNSLDTLYRFRRTIALSNLQNTVVAIVSDSSLASSAIIDSVDLVFIDGGHATEVAWRDYLNYAPKIRRGGTLAIHDVFEDPSLGGRPPYEIYCDALNSNNFQEIYTQGSLKILRRN